MTGKKAVHFGGGNIGRGFVAEFLHKAGYEIVFVDVMDSTIEALQKTKTYTVTEISDEGSHTTEVTNYRALNSKYELEKVVHEIATADLVTCAVGPNVLKFIAAPIASALDARKEKQPIAVIACENAIYATNKLRDVILEKVSAETKSNIKNIARFANSAVDRIVPTQDEGAGLNVKIESFWEWCVEEPPFEGMDKPNVEAIHYVENLEPYIERKLFTVNTGHATTAYFGKLAGKKFIEESLKDSTIEKKVHAVLSETADLIVSKHKIPAAEQKAYVDKIIARFTNPALIDPVERVGRQPLRKLSRNERLISPASQLAELGRPHEHLLDAVEAALKFQNIKDDDESAELATILKENDAETATEKITGLEKSHPLFKEVVERVKKVQG